MPSFAQDLPDSLKLESQQLSETRCKRSAFSVGRTHQSHIKFILFTGGNTASNLYQCMMTDSHITPLASTIDLQLPGPK